MLIRAQGIKLQYNDTGQSEIVLTTTTTNQLKADVSQLKQLISSGKELSVEVKQYRQKRSLDANSYCWLIISKIAEVLRSSKEEVYIEMLKRYGQHEQQLLSVVEEASEMIYRATQNHCVEVGTSELKGKTFKHFRILIGSSQYDSKAMATLIDGICGEAKELGIETMTPAELAGLKDSWGEKQKAS